MALALLAGCTNLQSPDDSGRAVRRYFGLVQIVRSPSVQMPPDAEVEGVRVYGLKLDRGLTLGFSQTSIVRVPADCRAVILVKSQEQLDQVKQFLSAMTKKGDLCGALTPD